MQSPPTPGPYSSAASGTHPFAPKVEYSGCQIVPAAAAPKARWSMNSWTDDVATVSAKECADHDVFNAAHGQKQSKYMEVCANLNQQPCVRQQGTLVPKALEGWVKGKVHERKAHLKSGDYGVTGAGDMEDSVFTRSKAEERAAAQTQQAQKTTEMLLMAVTQLASQLAKNQQ